MNAPARQALVVDDDRAMANVISFALTRVGFEVTVAHDGLTASQLASAKRFDLITSDYQMPHLNGEQFVKSVRAAGPSREAVMFLCSAKGFELDSERLKREYDLACVFYKPFSVVSLANVALQSLASIVVA